MVNIQVENGQLTVKMTGWDRFLALRGKVEVPLANIQSIEPLDPMPRLTKMSKGTHFVGSRIHGKLFFGMNVQHRKRAFWAIRATQEAISIKLVDHKLEEINVGVDNANMAIDQLNLACWGRTAKRD